MGTVVETMTAVVGADISDFTDKLGAARSKFAEFGDTLQSAGTKMIAIAAPILGFLGASVKAAADSENAVAQLNAVLKSTRGIAGVTAKQATGLASSLQKVTRYSDEDILSAENLLLTFTKIKKDTFPQVTKLALDMSTALGQDLKSSSIQLGKALQDPITGVTALRRVGVNFTQSQMDMIKAMMSVGNLAGAQKIILKELNTEFGGSAEAAGKTFAGQLDILKNQFGEVMESVGRALIPALQQLVKEITPIVTAIAGWIEKNPQLVVEIGKLALIITGGGGLLIALGSVIKAVGTLSFLLSPVSLLLAAIVGIVVIASNHFGGFANMLSIAATSARQLATIILLYVFDALTKAAGAATWLIDQLRTLLGVGGGSTESIQGDPGVIAAHRARTASRDPGMRGLGGAALFAPTKFGGGGASFRDSGGPVRAGQPVMVGRGAQPELFVPSSSGRMFPSGSYGGPQMLTIVLRADGFEEHIVVNIADAMRRGTQ